MAARLPASQQTRASAKDELIKLATRLIVEEALEGEAGAAPRIRPQIRDHHVRAAHCLSFSRSREKARPSLHATC
jgi:hypothetical protein